MDDLPRFLRVARALALTVAAPIACAGGGPQASAPSAAPLPSSSAAPSSDETAEVASDPKADPQTDPSTEGDGPCRCSWDTNASAAPRVCKKGETSYAGAACVPATRPKYPIAIGPLPPPDLPA